MNARVLQLFLGLGTLLILAPAGGLSLPVQAGESHSFSRDIQPLLAKHCVLCHGPDDDSAGLRLDQHDRALAVLESGQRAIVPGQPEASALLQRVSATDPAVRMPPEGDPLTPREIEMLREWIRGGARFEEHWAFRPVKEPPLPRLHNVNWPRNPIDHFVLAPLEQARLLPSPEAEPTVLVKRLYYDLVGLPPAPADVDAFMADFARNPDAAYETLVDRLLASEHFGERWGRHWLDMARYADSDGYEKDNPRPDAWRYRDWVIEAINRDLPFDQFTIEQLAGDLLPGASPLQQLATAFHRQTLTNTEGGTDKEEFRVEATFDRTETTGSIWLGLTLTCARCHSHKYDQISQREYYQLFAFFNNCNEVNTEIARSEAALEKYQRDKAVYDARVAELRQQYTQARQALQPEIDTWTAEMSALWADRDESPPELHPLTLVSAKATSQATLSPQEEGALLVSGPVADKDSYTLVFELPELPLTGLRLEVLPEESLPASGPGRADNGNFVLSELRAFVSETQDFKKPERIPFVHAEADYAQEKFPAPGALSTEAKSGWAIGPRMGEPHHWTAYTSQPREPASHKFLQIVLDQQYGGKHLLGRFRLSLISRFDPTRALPSPVIEALRTPAENRSGEHLEQLAEYVASLHPETAKLATDLKTLLQQAPPSPMMSVRVIAPAARTTKLLTRGDFLQPADEVTAEAFAVISRTHPLASRQPEHPPDRLDLARWLVDARHPLTPRVTVNHVWAYLFGRGIVPTVNDFGVRGEHPTHPELLDWLAWHFPRDMQWSRKQLIKTIVLSATYRQASVHRPELQEVDPNNRLLARQNRLRVQAEVVRDLYLAAGELLSPKIGGPSVFPPLPPGVAELSYANNFKWVTSTGEDAYRRGMYTFFKRTAPHPTLMSFDCPDSNTTSLIRETSNTPLQALVTLNNVVFTEAAQALARRVFLAGGSDRNKITLALRICIVRPPDSAEVDRFESLLQTARAYYREHPEAARDLAKQNPLHEIPAEEFAAWFATLRMILNLDEFIVRD
ncbi:MAG: PSD1 domain-containing protein [Planctomycetaceae bacterium]|nr:PSD1 domain-containing protein [Planctomycetaceae bacterium]